MNDVGRRLLTTLYSKVRLLRIVTNQPDSRKVPSLMYEGTRMMTIAFILINLMHTAYPSNATQLCQEHAFNRSQCIKGQSVTLFSFEIFTYKYVLISIHYDYPLRFSMNQSYFIYMSSLMTDMYMYICICHHRACEWVNVDHGIFHNNCRALYPQINTTNILIVAFITLLMTIAMSSVFYDSIFHYLLLPASSDHGKSKKSSMGKYTYMHIYIYIYIKYMCMRACILTVTSAS